MKGLSFDQSICWVFDCCESDLEALYWRYTYGDLSGKLKLRLGEFATVHLQQAHGMITVLGMALGGSKPKENIVSDVNTINRLLAGQA